MSRATTRKLLDHNAEGFFERWQSKRFPGFDVDFSRDSLLDPIELLMSHERVEKLRQPCFELYCNASVVEGIVTRRELSLLNGTIQGLSTRLPKWACDVSKLRRAEWASRER